MKIVKRCPICGSDDLKEFHNRPEARCAVCSAMERTRLMFALLERRGRLRKGMEVLHFAPEPGMARRLKDLAGRYVPADFDISQYTRFLPETVQVDLCATEPYPVEGTFDLIIHNHVLEHLPCNVGDVLRRLSDLLKPGGEMYFSTPIRKGTAYEEDLSPLSEEERVARFGQRDHLRFFGSLDVVEMFQDALGENVTPLALSDHLSDSEVAALGVNPPAHLSGNTIFCFRK